MGVELELCSGNLEAIKYAAQIGVKRVELCTALDVGGITPSYAHIEKSCELDIETHVLIRPRTGAFVYDTDDFEIIKKDILFCSKLDVSGVVVGCLTNQNTINKKQNQELADLAKVNGLEITFHRAFDQLEDQKQGLNQLMQIGFDRILTSGKSSSALEGKYNLKALIESSDQKIQIMAGGGVNPQNAKDLVTIGVSGLHFSAYIKSDLYQKGMGSNRLADIQKIEKMVSVTK